MDIIQFIILLTIALSGTVFGSFFTLAVHRIPRKEDITHERSYCPNCNHKLQFLDLIPVFSYIFLGGKCRYCQNKIRPRYLLLEIFSGLVFLLLGLSYGINIETTIPDFLHFVLFILFLCCIFIVGGIDKEKYMIPNGLLIYGLGISILNLIWNVWNEISIVTNMVGFLVIPMLLIVINLVTTKLFKVKEAPFGGGDIKYLAILGLFFGFGAQILILVISLLLTFMWKIYERFRKIENKKIAWGFYLSIAAATTLIAIPQITDIIEVLNFMIIV